jgi:hypothetical protein
MKNQTLKKLYVTINKQYFDNIGLQSFYEILD